MSEDHLLSVERKLDPYSISSKAENAKDTTTEIKKSTAEREGF